MPYSRAINYTLYQLGWLACVLGAAWGWPLLGAVLAIALTGVHLAWAPERSVEWRFILLTLAVGVVVEGLQVWTGTYARFTSGQVVLWMSPPWLLMMWVQFATTFRWSMRSVMEVPVRALVFGLVGGPVAFWAGERLGAVELARPSWPGFVRLSVCWGVALWGISFAVRAARPAAVDGPSARPT